MGDEDKSPKNNEAVERFGLRDSYDVSFPEILRMGFDHADTILFGDTDHGAFRKIWGALSEQENQIALAESTVGHIFLEIPREYQDLSDNFQRQAARDLEKDHTSSYFFNKRFVQGDTRGMAGLPGIEWLSNKDDVSDFVKNTFLPLMQNAARLDMKVHMLDTGRGMFHYDAMAWHARDIKKISTEIKNVQNDPDLEPNEREEELSELREEIREEYEEYSEDKTKFLAKRLDDKPLAEIVNEERERSGQKAAVLYGAAHGSRHNDFEEHLDGVSLTISLSPNREHFENRYAPKMYFESKFLPEIGEDPPDLIYFLDEGVLSTTRSTPPEIIEKLQNMNVPLIKAEANDVTATGLEEQAPANTEVQSVQGVKIK